MIHVGFDSAPIRKVPTFPDGTKGSEFVANLGVSVTVPDKDEFESAYDVAIEDAFNKIGAERKKRFYKGAHLVGQVSEDAMKVIVMIDVRMWNPSVDTIVAFTKQDQEQLKRLESFGYTLPSIIEPKGLMKTSKF